MRLRLASDDEVAKSTLFNAVPTSSEAYSFRLLRMSARSNNNNNNNDDDDQTESPNSCV